MKFSFRPDKGKDIAFTPDDIDDYEIAKQKVCNLLDSWEWLPAKINDEGLTWPSIFELVAKHI